MTGQLGIRGSRSRISWTPDTCHAAVPGCDAHVLELLRLLGTKGVSVWSEGGRLRYRAKQGTLTDADLAAIRKHKAELIATLDPGMDSQASLTAQGEPAEDTPLPLTFTQLAHFREYDLGRSPSKCLVSSATIATGPFSYTAWEAAFETIARRHGALRMTIRRSQEGTVSQHLCAKPQIKLEHLDLRRLRPDVRTVELDNLIEIYQAEALNIFEEPLIRARILRLTDSESAVVITMEHLVSDGHSMQIIRRELFSAYAALLAGIPSSMPAIEAQFHRYAVWQSDVRTNLIEKHLSYWKSHLHGCDRLRFPADAQGESERRADWGLVPFTIDTKLMQQMREWSIANRTTLVMAAFTAYIALVLRWCSASEAVFLFEIDGRESEQLRQMVGYLAFPLYLRVNARDARNFSELLRLVIAEYCDAYAHRDYSYLQALGSRAGFTHNSCFNWMPRQEEPWYIDEGAGPGELVFAQIPFKGDVVNNFVRDIEPTASLVEGEHQISGWMQFSLAKFSRISMQRFTANYISFLENLTTGQLRSIWDVPIV